MNRSKKQYFIPSLNVYKIQSASMICGSGDSLGSISNGNDDSEAEAPESSTTKWGTGIWAE